MSTLNERYIDNPIIRLSFDFALQMIDFSERLNKSGHYIVSKQLLKSGTSIGANVREAQNGESKNDFVHKMKIAMKEADETEYWLMLCKHSQHLPDTDEYILKLREIIKILNKIIATSKSRT